jgi:PST family polysaccharide transporter
MRLNPPVDRALGITGFVSFAFGDKVVSLGLNAIVTLLLVTQLSPDQFGRLSVALALVAFPTAAATLSSSFMVNLLSVDPMRRQAAYHITGRVSATTALVGVIALTAVAIFALADDPSLQRSVLILTIGLATVPLRLVEGELQADLRPVALGVPRLLGLASTIAALLWTWQAGAGIVGAAAAVAIGQVIHGTCLIAATGDRGGRRLGNEPSMAQTVHRRIVPLIVTALAIALYTRADQVMLGWLSTPEQTGYYAAAVRLVEIPQALPVILASAVGSTLARFKNVDEVLHARVSRALLTVSGAVAVLIIMITIAAAERGVVFLYGSTYRESAQLLRIQSLSLYFVFVGVLGSVWIANHGLEWVLMMSTLIGAAVNLCLNAIVIPSFGASGAAWATVFSYGVAAIGVHALVPATRQLFWMTLQGLLPLRWAPAVQTLRSVQHR